MTGAQTCALPIYQTQLVLSVISERFIVSVSISLIEFNVASDPVIPISVIVELIDVNFRPFPNIPVVSGAESLVNNVTKVVAEGEESNAVKTIIKDYIVIPVVFILIGTVLP